MKRLIVLTCALMAASPAVAQAPNAQPVGYGPPISVSEALAIIHRGMAEGTSKGHKMAFAVVEPSGELVAFARMDGVPYGSIRLAQQKARTSARLQVTTAAMEERVRDGRSSLLSSDEVIAIEGGVPIIANGQLIGALGVSGAAASEDGEVAEAAVASH